MRLGGVGGGPGVGSLAPAPGRGLGTALACAGAGPGDGAHLRRGGAGRGGAVAPICSLTGFPFGTSASKELSFSAHLALCRIGHFLKTCICYDHLLIPTVTYQLMTQVHVAPLFTSF